MSASICQRCEHIRNQNVGFYDTPAELLDVWTDPSFHTMHPSDRQHIIHFASPFRLFCALKKHGDQMPQTDACTPYDQARAHLEQTILPDDCIAHTPHYLMNVSEWDCNPRREFQHCRDAWHDHLLAPDDPTDNAALISCACQHAPSVLSDHALDALSTYAVNLPPHRERFRDEILTAMMK